jgi:hypothetical protein
MVTDYSGHTPTIENWQIQETDGTPLKDHDYLTRDEAITKAKALSEDYQIPLIVKQTM